MAPDTAETSVQTSSAEATRPVAVASAPVPPSPRTSSSAKVLPFARGRWTKIVLCLAGVVLGIVFLFPMILTALTTVSTDDAYVDGHVTFVAPRVTGQVLRVLVDDNYRVRKGDLLVEIDPEPFQVQVAIARSQLSVAESNLTTAHAQVLGLVGQTRAARYALDHAIETVRDTVASLRSAVAQRNVEKANAVLAEKDFNRYRNLLAEQAATQADFDIYSAKLDTARNRVESAEQQIQEIRAKLGLSVNTENPLDVPDNLEQNFSLVREALSNLLQFAAQLGYQPKSLQLSPKEVIEQFYQQDPQGNLDHIYSQLIPNAPAIKQAEAQLLEARNQLSQAELNLRYCKIYSEIDGVVTRRNVNPGNYLQIGQSLMAVRSLNEVWINANFKENQLRNLRIGQPVEMEVDMYGNRHKFNGRISGFTMGTGQTLALLPPQNATGNFVKIVQRLPVRIDVIDYDPEKLPLFAGLSVVPYVRYKEPATGPNAGRFLQEVGAPPDEFAVSDSQDVAASTSAGTE